MPFDALGVQSSCTGGPLTVHARRLSAPAVDAAPRPRPRWLCCLRRLQWLLVHPPAHLLPGTPACAASWVPGGPAMQPAHLSNHQSCQPAGRDRHAAGPCWVAHAPEHELFAAPRLCWRCCPHRPQWQPALRRRYPHPGAHGSQWPAWAPAAAQSYHHLTVACGCSPPPLLALLSPPPPVAANPPPSIPAGRCVSLPAPAAAQNGTAQMLQQALTWMRWQPPAPAGAAVAAAPSGCKPASKRACGQVRLSALCPWLQLQACPAAWLLDLGVGACPDTRCDGSPPPLLALLSPPPPLAASPPPSTPVARCTRLPACGCVSSLRAYCSLASWRTSTDTGCESSPPPLLALLSPPPPLAASPPPSTPVARCALPACSSCMCLPLPDCSIQNSRTPWQQPPAPAGAAVAAAPRGR